MKVKAENGSDLTRLEVLKGLLSLSEKALPEKPDLIVWPETAFPSTFHSDSSFENSLVTGELDQFLLKAKVPLLFGGPDEEKGIRYNALYLATVENEAVDRKSVV